MKPGLQLGALLVFVITLPVAAQIKLTGATAYDSQANGTFRGMHGWNTINDFYWNLYVFTGSVASPTFLNSSNTASSLNPNFTFQAGTNVLYISGASDPTVNLGVNLYFNGIVNKAQISAVVPNNGSTNFSIIAPGVQTLGIQTERETSQGSGSFTNGIWSVRLIGFETVRPPVDLVTPLNAASDGGGDTTARLTFFAERAEQTPLVIQVSEVRICWASETDAMYQLQYRSEATTNLWVNAGDPISANAGMTCTNQSVSGPQRFYRLQRLTP